MLAIWERLLYFHYLEDRKVFLDSFSKNIKKHTAWDFTEPEVTVYCFQICVPLAHCELDPFLVVSISTLLLCLKILRTTGE